MYETTLKKKKKFLQNFSLNNQFKQKEILWILNYIVNNNTILEKISFVDNAINYDNGLLISTSKVDTPAIILYKTNQQYLSDPEKIFEHLRKNKETEIYIQLNFEKIDKCEDYNHLIKKQNDSNLLSFQDNKEIENFLKYTELLFERKYLMIEIDKTLKSRNEKKFLKLTSQLKDIDEKIENISC